MSRKLEGIVFEVVEYYFYYATVGEREIREEQFYPKVKKLGE